MIDQAKVKEFISTNPERAAKLQALPPEQKNKIITEMFSVQEPSAFQQRVDTVESRIAERESALERIPSFSDIPTALAELVSPPERIHDSLGIGKAIQAAEATPVGQMAKVVLPISDIYSQLSESPGANVVLSLLEQPVKIGKEFALSGIASPTIITEAIKGITGEKRGEYGDLFRILGVPEPIAATLGLAATSFLDPFAVKQWIIKKGMAKSANLAKKWTAKSPSRNFVEFMSDRKKEIRNHFDDAKATLKNRIKSAEVGDLEGKAELAILQMDDEIAMLDNDLQLAVEKGALKTKPLIRKFMKRNGDIYSERLDDISNRLIDEGREVANEAQVDALSNTLTELADEGITEGRVISLIKKKMAKYGYNAKEDVIEEIPTVPFKEMVQDMRQIRDAGKMSVQEGNALAGVEEHMASVFSKNWGRIVASQAPEFKGLQKQYSKVIDVNKHANKIFQMFKGELDTDSAEKFLMKAIEGDLTGQERRLLKKLQDGLPGFGEGIGDLTAATAKKQARKQELIQGKNLIKQKFAEQKNAIIGAAKRSKQDVGNQIAKLDRMKNEKLIELENTFRLAKRYTEKQIKSDRAINWVKGIGGSILIYELVTRPIRRTLFKGETEGF